MKWNISLALPNEQNANKWICTRPEFHQNDDLHDLEVSTKYIHEVLVILLTEINSSSKLSEITV